jgi:hypothetical protein
MGSKYADIQADIDAAFMAGYAFDETQTKNTGTIGITEK